MEGQRFKKSSRVCVFLIKESYILKVFKTHTRDPSSLRSTCMRVQNSWGFLLRGGCVRLRTILVLGPRCWQDTERGRGEAWRQWGRSDVFLGAS